MIGSYDDLIEKIANYTFNAFIESSLAYKTARLVLLDSLGCALLATNYPECTKLLGPLVKGLIAPLGARVIGTSYVLDPVTAAFNNGSLIRWLDYNDTWLAMEWGHPSDNLGAILSICDFLSQRGQSIIVHDLLTAMIKAHEIQGILALENSLNRLGFDHVFFVKVASTAVVTKLLGGSLEQIKAALSQCFIDCGPLRTYRHAPNTGSRKSWAAADATSRAVFLALITLKEEMGYPKALTAKTYGFNDAFLNGNALKVSKDFDSYVMENVLFKVSFPAEFHAQTAVEAAFLAYKDVVNKWSEIEKIEIETHESAIRIISKKGSLKNPADRDHCLEYMVAIALLYGELTADHYEDKIAMDERIDILREKMVVTENKNFSLDYLAPEKRSIANSLKVTFKDGKILGPFTVEYPLGHRFRRDEAIPKIYDKFENNAKTILSLKKVDKILKLFKEETKLDTMRVDKFVNLFIV